MSKGSSYTQVMELTIHAIHIDPAMLPCTLCMHGVILVRVDHEITR